MRYVDPTEERALVAKAKEGDMNAFEDLVRAFQKPIYYLCLRMARAPQAADDLAQETFIKAFFALPQFRDGLDFYAWIRRIAVNSALNYLRSARREEPLGDREAKDMNTQPQDELLSHEAEKRFQEALAALPSDQKSVFILRVYENLSYREIAQTLGVSEGTVMSRLSRARHKLKDALAGRPRGGAHEAR
ncbi:MAG: sigma-70 family RNA polymerase sigma factor [Candidatus Aminicenantes bacterium]|nr:sigma-70 family RNA polymerase sigma factor [Candidatus Aminicenantes bacterium]